MLKALARQYLLKKQGSSCFIPMNTIIL